MPAPKQFRLLAKELKKLKSNGMTQPATLIKYAGGTRTLGSLAAGNNPTATEYACHVTPGTATSDKIGGTLVEKTDSIYLAPGKLIAGGVAPATTDQLEVDGETFRIVGVDNIAGGAAYTLLARK